MIVKNWTFSVGKYSGLKCTSPCSLYSVLLQHKKIDDPFYGLNEQKSTPWSELDCDAESTFSLNKSDLAREFVEITFYGLDTLCDIYINDTFIAHTINMHRTYRFNIKDIAIAGKNTVKLHFYSPIEYIAKAQAKHTLPQSNESLRGFGHIRKAFYMFGWDWGPILPDMGIWRDVTVDAYNGDMIDNVWVRQIHKGGRVSLDLTLETRHNNCHNAIAHFENQDVCFVNNKASIDVKKPKLWWANGYGEQYLYDLDVELLNENEVIDTNHQRIGLRTLTVSTKKDKLGNEFCFVLNGIKIFAMGADYVPQDNIIARITKDDIHKLIDQCVDANYNAIRVWGGGYYPSDDFYNACDEAGIIVWQDFMIACTNIRLTESFRDEMVHEAIDNVKRLRNHASLGMLCGNNEMEEAVVMWEGFADNKCEVEDHIELYERVLPEICEQYAPDIFYWPSSPSSGGGFDDPMNKLRGDSHFWDVWHGGVPYTVYRDYQFRFCSEYGFQSYPPMKTIRSFCEEKDLNCFSRVMENHQKNASANSKILSYIADHYLYPSCFENLVYASELNQAEAIKYGVEHFRRNRGICMGSLYWQVNDCWPVASWSSIDSFGRYKALHYYAKKFYAPVALGMFIENNAMATFNVANEQMKPFVGKLVVKVCDKAFNTIFEKSMNVRVEPLSSNDIITIDEVGDIYNQFISCELYDKLGNRITYQSGLLSEPKHFEFDAPELECEFAKNGDDIILNISSNTYAKGVYIDFDGFDVEMSDNYFDIINKNAVSIIIKTDKDIDELMSAIQIKTVYDIDK